MYQLLHLAMDLAQLRSKDRVEGALAYFKPRKLIPEHKFRGGGRKELIKQIRGPMIRRYYQGWTQFFKLAKDWENANFVILDDNTDVQVCTHGPSTVVTKLMCSKDQRVELAAGMQITWTFCNTKVVDAVAVIPASSPTFEVQRMDLELFINKGVREGAGILLGPQAKRAVSGV